MKSKSILLLTLSLIALIVASCKDSKSYTEPETVKTIALKMVKRFISAMGERVCCDTNKAMTTTFQATLEI